MSKTKKLTVGLLIVFLCTVLFTSAILIFVGEWGAHESYQCNSDKVEEYVYTDVNDNSDNVSDKSGTELVKFKDSENYVFTEGFRDKCAFTYEADEDEAEDDETNSNLFIVSLLIVISIIIFIFLCVTIVPGIVVLIVFKVKKRKKNRLKIEEGKTVGESSEISGSDAVS